MTAQAATSEAWVVFDYEADMFAATCDLLRANPAPEWLTGHVRNAVVESALLHSRQLIDILLSRGKDGDDIKLADLASGFQPTRLDELRSLYGDRKAIGSPCWTLNKMMAHPKSQRGLSFIYSDLLENLSAILADILGELGQYRSK